MLIESNFNFKDLFVLDMANNHQGDIEHGYRIIDEHSKIVNKHNVRAGIKFQFRDLPNFVHKFEQENPTNKHVPRFLSTMLGYDDYHKMVERVRDNGLLSICTPFDEKSVDEIISIGFDVIKIASCSAKDWPLLQAVSESGLPIIASTGGLNQNEVDDLVSFLNHRACDFALMHCVSIYPTPDADCNLLNVQTFSKRYPKVTIGWSTHEPPDEEFHVAMASSLGARMFERHIGVATDDIVLNKYSSNPAQCSNWISAYLKAREILGSPYRNNLTKLEKDSIDGLKRGVFLKADILKPREISIDDVYFAFPCSEGQISSSDFEKIGKLNSGMKADMPLMLSDYEAKENPDKKYEMILKKAIHEVKAELSLAGVTLNHEFKTEYSHHHGIENFLEVGIVLITVVNREYAKKILIQLKEQRHPLHMHKLKEETFLVIRGELVIELDGEEKILKPGNQITVPPGIWHKFHTDTGVVFEEISTTAFPNDSVYRDKNINKLSSSQRKTIVDHWGRFQIDEQLRKLAKAN